MTALSSLGIFRQGIDLIKHHGWLLVGVGLLMLFVSQILLHGQTLPKWDWLLLSGAIAFIVGIQLARQAPRKLKMTLKRLGDRGTLVATPEQLAKLEGRIQQTARNWARKGAIVTALAILSAFLGIYGLNNALLTLLETVGGYIAGWYLGRMSAYGALAVIIKQENLTLRAEPEHTDRVCGFKPLGDFYLFQALVAAVPAIFLAVWWVIIPIFPRSYSHWRQPYLGLLALAILFEILVFAVPMVLFHREMKRQKRELLVEADRLSREIVELRSQLVRTESGSDREGIETRLAYLLERHQKIERMTTWPVHPKSFRRFAVRNTLLFIPLLSELTGSPRLWEILDQILRGLIDG
jgi:hypothetical protein